MNARIDYLEKRIAELKESNDRTYALLLAIELRAQRQEQRITHRLLAEGEPLGLELKNAHGHFVAIVPEPGDTLEARLVRFGEDGLFGHEVYPSAMRALSEALTQGYCERADGTLDALARTERWRRGIRYTALMQEWNAGGMNFEEFSRATQSLYEEAATV